MKPTLVRLTFVNGILNPYSEKRPKKPEISGKSGLTL